MKLKISNFKLVLPSTPFNRLFALWLVALAVNILFSDAPAVSLLSLFSFFPINSFNIPLNSSSFLFPPALPLSPSWLVALSSMGASIKNAILGVGLGNFSNAFTQFRPVNFNQNPLWFFRFNQSASPALTTLVEQGLIGLFFWLFFFYRLYRLYPPYLSRDQEFFFNKRQRLFVKGFFVLAAVWLLSFLLPLPSLIFPLITLLSLISLLVILFLFSKKKLPSFHLVSILFSVLPLSLISLISLISLFLVFSPRLDANRFVTQSQIALAQAQNSAAKNPTDKKTIQRQVAAAIAAASRAINLNPKNSAYQMNLAVMASRLNNILANAPTLAADHFQKAIALDPANPQLYFEIGRFQFTQGDLYDADQNFATAVALKKDYAPAWFAVYQAERKLAEDANAVGNTDLQKRHVAGAKIALQTVEKLVCVNNKSEDCVKVRKEKELQ